MSTAVASIAENTGGGLYAYRCSKAGLNMSMKVSDKSKYIIDINLTFNWIQSLSVDLADTGVLVMAMHPGWVLTEMGGPNAQVIKEKPSQIIQFKLFGFLFPQITTETCCSTMIQTLDGLTEKVIL